jgi:hypothetical protein
MPETEVDMAVYLFSGEPAQDLTHASFFLPISNLLTLIFSDQMNTSVKKIPGFRVSQIPSPADMKILVPRNDTGYPHEDQSIWGSLFGFYGIAATAVSLSNGIPPPFSG